MAKVSTMMVMFGSDVGIGTPGSCFQAIVRGLGSIGNQITLAGNSLSKVLVRFCRRSEFHHQPVQELGIGFFDRVSERIAQHRGLSNLSAHGGV